MIRLFEDKDIKIVGDNPSESVRRYREQAAKATESTAEQIAAAKEDMHKAGNKIKKAGTYIEKDMKCCDGKGKCGKK